MKNRIFTGSIVLIVLLLVHAIPADAKKPIKIVTTIGQIHNAVEIIGGENVSVEGLMGPGVDPHLYKASESDVRKLADADVIFYNGLNLEAKMGEIFKKMGARITTVPLAEVIDPQYLLDSIQYQGHYDPHVWFDVSLWRQVVAKICDELIAMDPNNEEEYRKNAREYLIQLTSLDHFVMMRANELPENQRVLVTAHDAFRYFGRAYGFKVLGLQGISTQSEAGTADVKELADFISSQKIKAIFIESSIPERNIKAVQQAVQSRGWNVEIGGELFSDAMGDAGTFEGTYIGMVTHNINTIVDALK